jgi:hypothetical protein
MAGKNAFRQSQECHNYSSYGIRKCSKATIFILPAGIIPDSDAQIIQRSRNHLKILGTRTVISSKLHIEDPEILLGALQKQ